MLQGDIFRYDALIFARELGSECLGNLQEVAHVVVYRRRICNQIVKNKDFYPIAIKRTKVPLYLFAIQRASDIHIIPEEFRAMDAKFFITETLIFDFQRFFERT